MSDVLPPQAAEPLIELRHVARRFRLPDGGVLQAVRPTSLSIARGDAFCIVGRSGAGKSTLLRLINLLERPDEGRVLVAGQDLTALGRGALREARQRIGMIFQQFNLLQNLDVRDNVAFPLRLQGRSPRGQVAARVDECLALVGLADKARSFPAQLSGGQRQRVAIARALASRPDVLLCDEPTSALDAETTESVLATLRRINVVLGVTLVLVTHELPVAAGLCRHAAVFEDGAIAERLDLAAPASLAPATRLGRELAALAIAVGPRREAAHA